MIVTELFTPARRLRMLDDVFLQIRDAILAGEIPEGSRLPNERDLAVRFEVGRQVHINSWGIGSGVELSFGGIRQSGFGREKGLRALDEYSALTTTTVRVDAGPAGH